MPKLASKSERRAKMTVAADAVMDLPTLARECAMARARVPRLA